MATDTTDAGPTDDVHGGAYRYAALHVEDSAMVIYDEDNHRAWVRSDYAVGLDGMA